MSARNVTTINHLIATARITGSATASRNRWKATLFQTGSIEVYYLDLLVGHVNKTNHFNIITPVRSGSIATGIRKIQASLEREAS